MKGLEPSTFCMASRRSSQLSYIRGSAEYRARHGVSARPVAAPGGSARAISTAFGVTRSPASARPPSAPREPRRMVS